jgi:NAD(P)-dependent dehydrogenase (short-subunit alcohol dehydrogenase family)
LDELKGKTAIVSGASTPSGIGNAIARRFAAAGASVLVVAEGPAEQLEATARDCRALATSGARIESLLLDLSQAGAPEQMVAHAEKVFGRVDVLVNNAAARASYSFGTYTREQFDRVVGVNIGGAFFASQAVLPIMRRQGGGRIIHLASQLGHVTFNQRALYGLTKAALIHLTKSMAYELAKDNIIVNAISPGPIDTNRRGVNGPEVMAQLIGNVPAGRLGEPGEIADVALWLATSSPAFRQGQDIVVDGGYIIH